MKLTFLLAKDPTSEQVGDTMMMRQVLDLVGQDHDVSVICWSDRTDSEPNLVRLPKPPIRPWRIGLRAVLRNRSLLHARYFEPELRKAIEASDADAYVVVHHYMAEELMRSTKADRPFHVVNVVPEAPIWRHGYGLLGRLQASTIERDEARVASRAVSVGSYDALDAETAALAGARHSVWLNLTLPPAEQLHVAATPPRLVVLGDRTWAPNEVAWQKMLSYWPRIQAGIEGAELVAVGRPASDEPSQLPRGVRDLGFVDDLHTTLTSSRALVAPLAVGGGVRVKLLEAAAIGLPVVASSPAVGSLGITLVITPFDDPTAFIDRCRTLLLDPEVAKAAGRHLYAANQTHHDSGEGQRSVRRWLDTPESGSTTSHAT